MSLDHRFSFFPRPMIIAHRGSCIKGSHPENTLPAFREAVDLGAHGIELDIQLTRDGELAVFHDRSLLRLTGTRKNIDQLSSEELAQVRFLPNFNTLASGPLKIPLLQDVFKLLGDQIVYNIEIKKQPGFYRKLITRLGGLVTDFGLQQRVWLSSFDPFFLWQWHRVSSGIPAAYLFESLNIFSRLLCGKKFVDFLHPHLSLAPRIKRLRTFTKPMCFWTFNQGDPGDYLTDSAVFALITDNVPETRKIFRIL